MKFLHVADLHIGKILNQKSLLEDQIVILNQIIEMMKENNIENLIVAGDVYDRSIPSGEAVEVFNNFLSTLILDLNKKVYMITGNHDSSERLNFASSILKNKGLIICSYPKKPLECFKINDEYGSVNLYMLPYCSPLYSRSNFDTNVSSYQEMIKDFIEDTLIDFSERNILVTHHTVLHNNLVLKSDSENDLSIGGLEGIEGSYFKKFDYVALGHIHIPQTVGGEYIRYSGSPLKYSESEIGLDKHALMVEIKEKGNVSVTPLYFKPLYDMRKIEGTMEELLKSSSEDYVYVTLLDNNIIPDAMHKIKSKYPNALSLNYKNKSFSSETIQCVSSDFNSKSIDEQFSEFFRFASGLELSDDQLEILKEIEGELDEAN